MKISIIIAGVIIIAIAVIIGFKATGNVTAEPGQYDELAKCLTASGAKMYGAYWCSHCKNQKEMFGSSVQYIDYVECDANGDNANPSACQVAGIRGYPTWVLGDGQKLEGEQSLEKLASLSGCELH